MKFLSLCFVAVCTTILAAPVGAEDIIERKPLSIGTKIETGQIKSGEPGLVGGDPEDWYISRMGVNLTQEVTVNERLDIRVGTGGVFYYSFPVIDGNAGSQGTKFGPGITQAQAIYRLGDPAQSHGLLRFGYFPFKYNPDAVNLGEYLFRSMPYPSFVTTGGWSITDNARVRAQGIHFSYTHLDGLLRHDFLLHSERDFRPQGDFTPSYLVEVNAGAFQFGGGVSLFHFLPIQGKRLDVKKMGNSTVLQYDEFPTFTVTQRPDGTPDTVTHQAGRPLTVTVDDMYYILNNDASFASANQDSLVSAGDTVTYTFKGVKLMARASFNIQKIVPLDRLNPEDLKVYGEIALLGWEDQPGYYENRYERMPIMLGINLPTFKLIDRLALEVEYFGSPLPDDFDAVLLNTYPTYLNYSLLFHDSDRNRRDDWKWSLYASRQLTTGLSVSAQVANDHYRTITQQNLFSGQSHMRNPSNWYYVVSLNIGI